MKDKKTVRNVRDFARILLGMGIFGIGLSLFSFDSFAAEGKRTESVFEMQFVATALTEEPVELAANTDLAAGEVEWMQNQNATVTGGPAINIRAAASTNSDRIAKAPNGTPMIISGKTTGEDGMIWYQVSLTVDGNAIAGFIRSDYVALGDVIPDPEPEPEVPAEPETPTESEAAPEQTVSKPSYEAVLETKEDGTVEWYLYDNDGGLKYPISQLMDAAKEFETLGKQVDQQKIIIIAMVVVIVILVLGVTLLIFKVKDSSMDDDDDEEEGYEEVPPVRRKRSVNEEGTPVRRTQQGETRPVKRTVQDGQPRPKQGSKPVQRTERQSEEPVRRPVSQGNRQRAAAPRSQEREVVYEEEPEIDNRNDQNGAWRSKNFLTEDDEFEFEFLNMDDPNKL